MAKKTTKLTPQKTKPRDSPSSQSTSAAERTREWNWTVVVALVLVAAVVGGVLAWYFWPEPDYTYRAYPFTKDACPGTDKPCYFAILEIEGQPYTIPFEHHPTEVESILFEYAVLDYLRATRSQDNPLVIIGVPENAPASVGVAGAQLSRLLGKRYGVLNMEVVARTIGTGEDQVDCRHATLRQHVILFEQGSPSGVFVKAPNCIAVRAETPEALLPVIDAYSYRLLGIIPTFRPSDAPNELPLPPRGKPANSTANEIAAPSDSVAPEPLPSAQ